MTKISLNTHKFSLEQQISEHHMILKKEFPEQEFSFLGKGGLNFIFSTRFKGKKITLRVCNDKEIFENFSFIREKINMTKINHPNLSKVYSRILNTGIMLIEYCGEVSFEQRFSRTNKFILKNNFIAYHKVMKAVEYLISQELVHCDLKCGNILFHRHENNPKIIDYDTLKKSDSKETYDIIFCSLGFAAPELFTQEINDKIDIFGLGSILYKLTQVKEVFRCSTTVYLLDNAFKEYEEYKEQLKEPLPYYDIPIGNNKTLKELINKMREPEPENRIGIYKAIDMFESAMPKEIKSRLKHPIP